MDALADEELIEFPPPDPDDPLWASESASDALPPVRRPVPPPERQTGSQGLVVARATVNLPGLRQGRVALVDPQVPYIAAALRSSALVPLPEGVAA